MSVARSVIASFATGTAAAIEPICPGGTSPRADITKCMGYEVLTNCITGIENQCWIDNGYTQYYGGAPLPDPYENGRIVAGVGAVGVGYIRGRPQPGRAGIPYDVIEPVPGFPSTAMNFRYYIRYSRGYASFGGGHNIQMESLEYPNVTGCGNALKFQLSSWQGITYYPLTCGVGSFTLPANKGLPTLLRSNRWYLVEVQGIMDTACTDINAIHGCNGIVRVWLDEQLITEYTDLNMGGVVTSGRLKWGSRFFAPEMFFHYGNLPWSVEVAWDNFVISNTGTYIGPAANENSRGTGDPSSPYATTPFTYEAWLGRRPGPDCGVLGYLGPYSAFQYRSGGSLQNTITHGLYVNGCALPISSLAGLGTPATNTMMTVTNGTTASDCTVGGGSTQHNCLWNGSAWVATSATDNALQINLTSNSAGGGVLTYGEQLALGASWTQWASYGWIYLPSTNNYTVTNLALAGFTHSDTTPASGYVALTLSGGNWAVGQKDTGGVSGTVATSTAVTFDAWHEYELIIWNDNTVSLMIDRVRLLTRAALPRSTAWAFPASGAVPDVVVGVIDFQGTQPFVAYFDDNTVTTASAWSCDGWGAASCPFSP